jgi:eukaryotic-like serine/threonine-protein kinase
VKNNDFVALGITPDAKTLLLAIGETRRLPYIATMPLDGKRELTPLVRGSFAAFDPRFSPDGRWVAYTSVETGREEIYVVPFPLRPGKWQVSTNGGRKAQWRGDGRELYFLTPDNMMTAVEVDGSGPSFSVGAAHPLFRAVLGVENGMGYDVSPDGQRFWVNVATRDSAPLTVVANWNQNGDRM